MIKFQGELSDECKRYIQKSGAIGAIFISIIVTIVISIILIIIGILWEWFVIYFVIIPILMTLLTAIPEINSPIKKLNLYLPKKLIIESERIEMEGEKNYESRQLLDVKKVVDFGKGYHIIFYFPNKSLYIICQKDLIVKGTIEEFEKLFEGKLEASKIQN